MLLSYVVLEVFFNLKQLLELIQLGRAQLGLIQTIKLLELIEQLDLPIFIFAFLIVEFLVGFQIFEVRLHAARGA